MQAAPGPCPRTAWADLGLGKDTWVTSPEKMGASRAPRAGLLAETPWQERTQRCPGGRRVDILTGRRMSDWTVKVTYGGSGIQWNHPTHLGANADLSLDPPAVTSGCGPICRTDPRRLGMPPKRQPLLILAKETMPAGFTGLPSCHPVGPIPSFPHCSLPRWDPAGSSRPGGWSC